jgi:hypothetical protein
MNEVPPLPSPSGPVEPESTLFERLTNVFVAPGEVVEGLKTAPRCHWNWLLPMILVMVAGLVFVFVAFSQDSVMHELREAPEQAIQKQIDSGKLPKEQGDKMIEGMEKFMSPTLFKIFGALGVMVVQPAILFGVALTIWLVGTKFYKARFGYFQAVEAVGLMLMISVVGSAIQTFLVIIKGSMLASAGPVLLVGDISMSNPRHRFLSVLNVPELWLMAALTIALARLGNTSFGKAALWIFGFWGLLRLIPTLPGLVLGK